MGSIVKRIVGMFADTTLQTFIEQTIPDDSTDALLWWKDERRDRGYLADIDIWVSSPVGLSHVKYSIEKKQLQFDAQYTMSAKARLIPGRQIKAINREYDYQCEAVVLTRAEIVILGEERTISLLPPGKQAEEEMTVRVVLEELADATGTPVRMFVDMIAKHCTG